MAVKKEKTGRFKGPLWGKLVHRTDPYRGDTGRGSERADFVASVMTHRALGESPIRPGSLAATKEVNAASVPMGATRIRDCCKSFI